MYELLVCGYRAILGNSHAAVRVVVGERDVRGASRAQVLDCDPGRKTA